MCPFDCTFQNIFPTFLISRITKYASWLGDEMCKASLVCPELTGAACADYGIEIAYGEEEANKVCCMVDEHAGFMQFFTVDQFDLNVLQRYLTN